MTCSTIFPSGNFFEDSTNIQISGTCGPCPSCGERGRIIEGTFDYTKDDIIPRQATPEALDVLSKLKSAMAAAELERLSRKSLVNLIARLLNYEKRHSLSIREVASHS